MPYSLENKAPNVSDRKEHNPSESRRDICHVPAKYPLHFTRSGVSTPLQYTLKRVAKTAAWVVKNKVGCQRLGNKTQNKKAEEEETNQSTQKKGAQLGYGVLFIIQTRKQCCFYFLLFLYLLLTIQRHKKVQKNAIY